jgi:hypothetical protein
MLLVGVTIAGGAYLLVASRDAGTSAPPADGSSAKPDVDPARAERMQRSVPAPPRRLDGSGDAAEAPAPPAPRRDFRGTVTPSDPPPAAPIPDSLEPGAPAPGRAPDEPRRRVLERPKDE